MKLKIALLCLVAAGLLGACIETPNIPQRPTLNISLPVSGTEMVWNSADHKGKPVLVAIMASYCGWCKRSLSALEEANKTFKDQGVEIIGVYVDNDEQKVEDIKKQYALQSTILYQGGEAAQDLNVQGFPHIILFDKNHKQVKEWSGYADTLAEQYKEEINKLIK